MSYPGTDANNPLNGEGAFVVVGAIVMGPSGPMTEQYLGQNGVAILGETSGPNAVNPSGDPSGIRLATQGGFRSSRKK
jgi:hypothetical protein